MAALVLVLSVEACAGSKAAPQGASAPHPDQLSEISVARFPGGWGSGAHLKIVLYRDRPSRFVGVREAERIGAFTATLPPEVFDSLARYYSALPVLLSADSSDSYQRVMAPAGAKQWDRCFDMPRAGVGIVVVGQRHAMTDECDGPAFLAKYVAPVEQVAARLDWKPAADE